MTTTNPGLHASMAINSSIRPSTAEATGHHLPVLSDRAGSGPLPLPSFVFPARGPSASTPSSFSRASGRRPVSAIDITAKVVERKTADHEISRTPELPAFSFGGRDNSPPISPRTRTIPSRSGSHQRGTSEFIGGDGPTGSSTIPLSTSPTNGEGVLPPPPGTGPPGGRRGHRHVRSAAISCHDISMILKPTSPTASTHRGSSAPSSPSGEQEVQNAPAVPTSMDTAIKTTEVVVDSANSAESSPDGSRTTPKALNRARVGFSDNIEVIPRPLSMISSDSSSTVTARQGGHSVSNSLSSIISAGTSSPPPKDKRGMPYQSRRTMNTRPRTAEPILDHQSAQHENGPKRRNSIPLLTEAAARSSSAPSTPRSTKKWSFFGHDSNNSGDGSLKSRPTSAGSGGSKSKLSQSEPVTAGPEVVTPGVPRESIEQSSSRRSSISRKPSKKQKKVRTWAGSILGRKTRQRSQKQKLNRRSPTPPHRSYPPMEETAGFEYTQSEEEASKSEPEADVSYWKPRKMPVQDESMSPMIDLDAALGPFNTPSSFGVDWENSQKTAAGTKKRAMHSAAGFGGFAGPGMHYHRRTESAPEFENPRLGLHRLGSSSTMAMADVFEEDEDEWEDTKTSDDKDDVSKTTASDYSSGLGINIKVEDMEPLGVETDLDMFEEACGLERNGGSLGEGDLRTVGTAKSEHSATSLIDEPIMEESTSPVQIMDDSSSFRPDSRARSSDSTVTPPFRPRLGKELAPVEIQPYNLQQPYLTPTSPPSTTQSSLPSPRSPFSYDTQRISTAPSSLADEHGFQSLLLGEPGPEVRYSVDDVPSLTSSNSTTTRDSGHPGAGNPQFREGQRSASLSSAAATRKRSSIVSLSRLISSSHGEKSKLSIESRAPVATDTEKKEKSSKSKRISRLMQFWKPKDLTTPE